MISIQWDQSRLESKLSGLSGAIADLRPAWGDVHRIFMRFMEEQFKSEATYASSRWQALNETYAEWKRRHYGDLPILTREGELRHSFTQALHPDHVLRTGPTFVEMGSRRVYAKAHQYGYPPRNLPSRPIIVEFTKAEGERIVDAIAKHLIRGMRGQR